jgi:hypothetical protein
VRSLLAAEEESLEPIAEQMAKILEQISPFPVLFPPSIEEEFPSFRGFVLSGPRCRGRAYSPAGGSSRVASSRATNRASSHRRESTAPSIR